MPENHYSVVFCDNLEQSAVFEGSRMEVFLHLWNNQDTMHAFSVYDGEALSYVAAEDFVLKVKSESFVPKYYRMDPETEDVIFAAGLAAGMVVLEENPEDRSRLENDQHDWERERLLKNNRWCTVSGVQSNEGGSIFFLATYEDGTKSRRVTQHSRAWYVKIDSIGKSLDQVLELRNQIMDIVKQGLRSSRIDLNEVAAEDFPGRDEDLAYSVTTKIFDLL
jgi:hypothetical protein